MGLGSLKDLTLAEARVIAATHHQTLRNGGDPKRARHKLRIEAKQRKEAITFEETAKTYIETKRDGWKNKKHAQQWTNTTGSGTQPPRAAENGTPPYTATGGTPKASVKKQFYGSIELDAIQAKKQFSDLVDEVILQFTSRPGVKVKIAIEIQADSTTGFDDGLQRAVKENCNVLKFKNAEFEGDE